MKLRDLRLSNRNLVLDAGGELAVIEDAAVIAQDLRHAIMQSRVALNAVGEGNADYMINQLRRIIVSDGRIKPESINFAYGNITAQTVNGEKINIQGVDIWMESSINF